MTTIACNGKSMSADTQQNGDFIDNIELSKVFKINKCLVGTAGDAAQGERFMDWFKANCEDMDNYPKGLSDFEAIVCFPDQSIYYYGKEPIALPAGIPSAIGSGGAYAMAAMMAGAPPSKAVRIACELDTQSGLPVHTRRL